MCGLNNNGNTASGYFTMDAFWELIMASSCHMQIYDPLLVHGTKGITHSYSTLQLIKPCRHGDNSRNKCFLFFFKLNNSYFNFGNFKASEKKICS